MIRATVHSINCRIVVLMDFKLSNALAITLASLIAVVATTTVIARASRTIGKEKEGRGDDKNKAGSEEIAERVMMRRIPRLDASKTVLLVCDVQERFRSLIYKSESLSGRTALVAKACRVLKIPVVVTEQVPRVFGSTVPDLQCTHGAHDTVIFDKKKFSMMVPEVDKHWRHAPSMQGRTQVLLCGIEAHVCVLQTALDVLQLRPDADVFVVCDAVSSQRPHDRATAIERLAAAGATMTSAESCLFDLLRSAEHPDFKAVSSLIKEANALDNEFGGQTTL